MKLAIKHNHNEINWTNLIWTTILLTNISRDRKFYINHYGCEGFWLLKKRKTQILITSLSMWFFPYIVQIYDYVQCCYFDSYRLQEFLGERGKWGARFNILMCFIFQVKKIETFNFKTRQHVHDVLLITFWFSLFWNALDQFK
jgi:hypothetical protein